MGMREAYMEERAKKLVTVIAMTLAIVALLGQVLVDVVRRQRSREVCVAVLYENYIRCDNGVDHYRQTVRIESPTDVERLELAPYAGGRMCIDVTDNCRLSEETLTRLRDWAATNGLAEIHFRSNVTLRGIENVMPDGGTTSKDEMATDMLEERLMVPTLYGE